MGKKRKRQQQHQQQKQKNKNKKTKNHHKSNNANKCWIETCKGNKPPWEDGGDNITLSVTRVDLFDDHNPISKTTPTKKEGGDISTQKEMKINTNDGLTDQSNGNDKIVDIKNDERLDVVDSEVTNDKIAIPISSENNKNSEEIHQDTKPSGSSSTEIDEKKSSKSQCAETEVEEVSMSTPQRRFINSDRDMSSAYIHIDITNSAKGSKMPFKQRNNNKKNGKFFHLPNGDCGDGIINPFPDIVEDKYWAQRKRLFQKFDSGIMLDKESWFSVTPEVIANHITNKAVEILSGSTLPNANEEDSEKVKSETSKSQGAVVLDAFCGCGGNAISFAKSKKTDISLVVCIDIDRAKLRMAATNASIYDVDPERIVFIEGDAVIVLKDFYKGGTLIAPTVADCNNDEYGGGGGDDATVELCKGYRIGGYSLLPSDLDLVFLSPPWGGINYMEVGKIGYDLRSCIKIPRSIKKESCDDKDGDDNHDIDGEELLCIASNAAICQRVIYYLPRNLNGILFGRSALMGGYESPIELEQNVVNSKLKTITAYLEEGDK